MKNIFLIILCLFVATSYGQVLTTATSDTMSKVLSKDTLRKKIVETTTISTITTDTITITMDWQLEKVKFYTAKRDAAIDATRAIYQARIQKIRDRFNPKIIAHKQNFLKACKEFYTRQECKAMLP